MKPGEGKHLLILTPGFPKDEQDSTCLPAVQQFILSYKNEFPQHRISIISLHYPHDKVLYTWNGINVIGLGGKHKGSLNTWAIIAKAILQVRTVNKQNRINEILSFWLTDTSLVGKICAMMLGIPYLAWMHGQDAKAGNRYYRLIRPNSKNLAAISDFQNDVFYKAYGRKAAHVVHNGIDIHKFPLLNEGKRKIDLLAAGYLNSIKRYDLFIQLVHYLKEQGCEVKAVLAGGGALDAPLKALVSKYKLESNFEFKGEIPHEQVLALMNDSKLFVHTSEYEGHSSVLLEALYSGCRILSFMPVDTEPIEGFYLCSDFEEMKSMCLSLLGQELHYKRGRAFMMTKSVRQIDKILSSLK